MKKNSTILVISVLFACSSFFGCTGNDKKYMKEADFEKFEKVLNNQVDTRLYGGELQDLNIGILEKIQNKDVLFSIFYSATVPEEDELKGEYQAKLLETGGFSRAFEMYINNWFGPENTEWMGKAFGGVDGDKKYGYNIFQSRKNGAIIRKIKFETFIAKTRFKKIDEKESYHLKYKTYNDGLKRGVRDEIRKINDHLYLGIGSASWGFGTANPGFFVLYGNPSEWKDTE